MKPDQPDPAEIHQRVRQQLILAQVRIMELEDARDAAAGRLAEIERLLQAAQALADQKLDEAAHSEKIRFELLVQGDQLRQLQTATTAALATTRTQLEETIAELETELGRLKSSRSWRWTAWLRALGGSPP
jgi:hypothetical protein